MKYQEFKKLESQYSNQSKINFSVLVPAVKLLLEGLRKILFKDGVYIKLRWTSFKRLWQLYTVVRTFVNSLFSSTPKEEEIQH